ncbi:MAG: hypothetical protein EA424_15575 [Planctomycetaceae bacterium]|nr:MAG: hypothetical protein EA424_15575 [Planctomycetaceae bacterium]
MPVAKDHEAINGDWYWEYSADHLHQVDDAEQIRDHLLRAIFGAFSNAMKHFSVPRTLRRSIRLTLDRARDTLMIR